MGARVSARDPAALVLVPPSHRLGQGQKVGVMALSDHTITLAPSGRPRVWNGIF